MKTAISVPDETYGRVDRLARRMGMSRSEFFSTAAARWADELEAGSVTEAIDRALAAAYPDEAAADADAAFALEAGRQTLTRAE